MALEQLDKYELLERLGRGGMGEVWKARDTQLRRYVAIKLLHADLQANPDFVTHFLREAQLVASLHHPNIVQIHDFQLTNTQGSSVKAYMVMDYIEGGTLADYIRKTVRKGFFPQATEIVYLFTAVGLALDYAHQKGMIHRDIKPANILLDRTDALNRVPTGGDALNRVPMGEPILSDFGIARLQGAGTSTVTRDLIGTPLYISPEQAEGQAVNERSDLYSLGIILYEIVTGITPFRGDNPIAIMMQHMREKPTSPALINPNIPPALSAVVLQSIAKDPQARFPSATAMTVAIAQAFNLPIPTSLSKPRSVNEQPGYNPLQPSQLSSGLPVRPAALAGSLPAAFTPDTAGYPESQIIPPPLSPPPSPTPSLSTRLRPRRRPLYVALIACVVLLVLGISAVIVFPLLFSTTSHTPDVVFGRIVFVHSASAPQNAFDQLQIDLENIPSPPANTTYYAWLVNTSSPESAFPPHWPLQFSNGSIHSPSSNYSYPNHPDLYSQSHQFLITAESVTGTPVVPGTPIYYAIISQTSSSSPTFEVRQCPPAGGSTNAGNPCG